MPIEIRELVIKATVNQSGESGNPAPAPSHGSNNISASEEIINSCVEKIMGIIKDKYER
jgi:hypothetical protein